MDWYLKYLYAQDMASYLQSIGAGPDIVQYINSQEPQFAQLLTNEFRKNHSITLQQLQTIQKPEKINPYTGTEQNHAARYPAISQWILVNYRRLRKGRMSSEKNLLSNILTQEEYDNYLLFDSKISQIYDWYRNVNPDIASYSAAHAIHASDEWHALTAQQGKNKIYDPVDPELISYGPKWKNKNWDGWTIQKIVSGNDLEVEGNKMNHCVGSYCEQVEAGDSIIYSLRDPNNNPHVTMEVNSNNEVEQIQGNSNKEPKEEYKAMIKEWIQSDKNKDIKTFSDSSFFGDPFPEFSSKYDNNDVLLELINDVGHGSDTYGLEISTSYSLDDIADMAIRTEMTERSPDYRGPLAKIPEALIDMALIKYKNDPEKLKKEIDLLENYAQKLSEETWEWSLNWDLEGNFERPNREDFKTDEEFEKEKEKIMEQEDEYRNEEMAKTPQGGFSRDVFRYIHNLREKGILPAYTPPISSTLSTPSMANQNHNWYKKAQYAPISIILYNQTYNELGISFNGGPKYTYYHVNPYLYNKIKILLSYKNYKATEKILRALGKYTTQHDKPHMIEPTQTKSIGNNWYKKILFAQIWDTKSTGTFEDNLKAMYELEYKLQALENFKWKGNPERLQNIKIEIEKELEYVIQELKDPLLQTFSGWLSSHALLSPQTWAEQRVNPANCDYIDEVGGEGALQVTIDEYKRYQNNNQPWHNYTQSPNFNTALKEMLDQAFANIDRYPSLLNLKENYIREERERMENNMAGSGIKEFGLDVRNQEFKTQEEAEAWIEEYLENFDISEFIYYMEGLDEFISSFERTGGSLEQLLIDLNQNLVFPLWKNYWSAMGIEETRELCEEAYRMLENASSLSDNITAINHAIDVSHQNGDMIDHMETFVPDIDADISAIKSMMENLSAGKFVPEWNKQLRQIGVSIPRAATRPYAPHAP